MNTPKIPIYAKYQRERVGRLKTLLFLEVVFQCRHKPSSTLLPYEPWALWRLLPECSPLTSNLYLSSVKFSLTSCDSSQIFFQLLFSPRIDSTAHDHGAAIHLPSALSEGHSPHVLNACLPVTCFCPLPLPRSLPWTLVPPLTSDFLKGISSGTFFEFQPPSPETLLLLGLQAIRCNLHACFPTFIGFPLLFQVGQPVCPWASFHFCTWYHLMIIWSWVSWSKPIYPASEENTLSFSFQVWLIKQNTWS